ncbi:MAG: maleylacetoacetate isomerase [Rhizobiales bacterium]|nr:maleylacetoacetate isomerase [Hyphomicrobiales bacterium]
MRTLYTFFRSSTSYRVRIALAVKGLEWEPRYISLPKMEHRSAAYMDINPQGLVPALIDGGLLLAQSLAILEYLDEVYPEPRILPDDPAERAYVRGLAQIVGCDMHPLNNIRVLKWLKARWGFSDDDTNEWYRHWIAEGLRAFEATLVREERHGLYCLGNALTIADICLVPQVANARRFACDLAAFPLTTAIADRTAALPAVESVAPQTQADAF